MDEEAVLDRMLEVMEHEMVPLSRLAVAAGNKVFGAAILDRHSLALVVKGSNRETENPLWHGEVSCLNDYWAMKAEKRPAPADCLFLTTHEPCPLCLSAITWSGFDNFYYFYTYEDSRDEFSIPHDLKILDEVFACPNGSYVRSNAFWKAHSLYDMIQKASPAKREQRLQTAARIRQQYLNISDTYQNQKGHAHIPFA